MIEIVRCPLRTIALVSLLLGIGQASPSARADQRVGVDSAVNPNAMGIPPGPAAAAVGAGTGRCL